MLIKLGGSIDLDETDLAHAAMGDQEAGSTELNCSRGSQRGSALRSSTTNPPPRSPNAALPRSQLAEATDWWPFYNRAFHPDMAARRARAAAGDLDWSPAMAAT